MLEHTGTEYIHISDKEQMAKVSAKEVTDRVASDIDKVWHPAPAPVRRALP